MFTLIQVSSHAQSIYDNTKLLELEILKYDSLFWTAYNKCDVEQMTSFLTDDIEFYHDKGGLTKGLTTFKKTLETNLCADGPRLKRVAKEGSVEVFPLNGIGAIISGDHYFYIGDKVDGLAKFTHVWRYENNTWKMARVLSYDHQPAANEKKSIGLSEKTLAAYAGKYLGPQTGDITISKKDNKLEMKAGAMELLLHAQTETLFFHKQSSLTFEFILNESGRVVKMVVRENGSIVEEVKPVR